MTHAGQDGDGDGEADGQRGHAHGAAGGVGGAVHGGRDDEGEEGLHDHALPRR